MALPAAGSNRDFTPAVPLLWAYDPIVSLLTREDRWRGALVEQIAPGIDDVIADVGCGTASLLVRIAEGGPVGTLIGVDPDERILVKAGAKLDRAGVTAVLRQGYLREVGQVLGAGRVDKIVSSLVFHQVPLDEKRCGLAAMFGALRPGGEIHIADYGLQRTVAMRFLFRIVQCVDGFADTQPNADGILPSLMAEAGFAGVAETRLFNTATGSISLYRGTRPAIVTA